MSNAMCSLTSTFATSSLQQQCVNYALSTPSNGSNDTQVMTFREKTPAEMAGEYVLRPLIDKVAQLWEKVPSLTLPGAEATMQTVINLEPGQSIMETCSRKVALCKRGKTAWNDNQSCNYAGPDMYVEVKHGGVILFAGTLGGSMQWVRPCQGKDFTLYIKNKGKEASSMYVHTENDGTCGCTVM